MKLGSSRAMDTKRPRGSERSKPRHELQLTRRSQPPYPWPPEQAQPGVSKPCRTTRVPFTQSVDREARQLSRRRRLIGARRTCCISSQDAAQTSVVGTSELAEAPVDLGTLFPIGTFKSALAFLQSSPCRLFPQTKAALNYVLPAGPQIYRRRWCAFGQAGRLAAGFGSVRSQFWWAREIDAELDSATEHARGHCRSARRESKGRCNCDGSLAGGFRALFLLCLAFRVVRREVRGISRSIGTTARRTVHAQRVACRRWKFRRHT